MSPVSPVVANADSKSSPQEAKEVPVASGRVLGPGQRAPVVGLRQDLERVRELFRSGHLLHPLPAERAAPFLGFLPLEQQEARGGGDGAVSFADAACGLALSCGLAPKHLLVEKSSREGKNEETQERTVLLEKEGACERRSGEEAAIRFAESIDAQHIVFILCDGLGRAVLDKHADAERSFLRRHNDANYDCGCGMRAVFPATTPAALTTLATGVYPGEHGAPGWELRMQKRCEYPCCAAPENPAQLRILHQEFTDMRGNRPMHEQGWTADEIMVAEPWLRGYSHSDITSVATSGLEGDKSASRREGARDEDEDDDDDEELSCRVCGDTGEGKKTRRKVTCVNAYLGSQFTDWFAGAARTGEPIPVNGERIMEVALDTLRAPEGIFFC